MAIEICQTCKGEKYITTEGEHKGIAGSVRDKCPECDGFGVVCQGCGKGFNPDPGSLGPLPCACEVDPKRRKSIHVDRNVNVYHPIADYIIANWEQWEAEAGQQAQQDQECQSYTDYMRDSIEQAVKRFYTRDWGR